MVGLSLTAAKFANFAGCLVLLELIGSCLGILIGCTSNDINDARTTLVPTLAPLLIFSGYVVPYNNIPVYFTWAYYASFFQYSFALLMINEFADRTFAVDCPAELAEKAIIDALRQRFTPPATSTAPLQQLPPWSADNPFGPNCTVPSWANWTHWINGTLPLDFACTGRSYLEKVGMWPNRFGALHNYFVILAGYLLLAFVCTYLVLHRVASRKLH